MPFTIGLLPNIGPLELAIVLAIVIVILGPKRIPEAARSVGQGFRNFKGSLARSDDDEPEELTESRASDPTERKTSAEKKSKS